MISRVRLEAIGASAGIVEESLDQAAASLDKNLFDSPVARGQSVIERDLKEPEGTLFAWRGRLLLHPNIG